MIEQLAVVKGISFGNRDIGTPCLWFSAYVNESVAALQVLVGANALKSVEESGVHDIKELEGRPCWVEVDDSRIRFLRFWRKP